MKIFLDDYRIPLDAWMYMKEKQYQDRDWVIVKNYDEFVRLLNMTKPENIERISFDHDLAPEHYAPKEHWINYDAWEATQDFEFKTGLDCCDYFIEYMKKNNIKTLPKYSCHSKNIGRRIRILHQLTHYRNGSTEI